MTTSFGTDRTVHLRHDGRSHELRFGQLNITASSSDDEIRQAVAYHLDIGSDNIRKLIVERHENGNITLRPEAVFG